MRRPKATVGTVAIALLLLLTFLDLVGVISTGEWITAEVIVAVVANVIFHTVGKQKTR